MAKEGVVRERFPVRILGNVDSLTGSASPTQFLVNLTKYLLDEDRRHWRANSQIHEGEEQWVGTIGVAIIRLPRSAKREEILQLSQSIHRSIRPLDVFARMTECGFWILYQGDELGCKRAIERVEEEFLSRYESVAARRHMQSSLKVRLIMRRPRELRNAWVERIDAAHFM